MSATLVLDIFLGLAIVSWLVGSVEKHLQAKKLEAQRLRYEAMCALLGVHDADLSSDTKVYPLGANDTLCLRGQNASLNITSSSTTTLKVEIVR